MSDCFVAIGHGRSTLDGQTIDCDALYEDVIRPAVTAAGLEPVRGVAPSGRLVDTAYAQQLTLCDIAVVDITLTSASILSGLGMREALRPTRTITLASRSLRHLFDDPVVQPIWYSLSSDGGVVDAGALRTQLTDALTSLRRASRTRPLFSLVEGWGTPPVERLKTDIFRDQVHYDTRLKYELAVARDEGREAVRAFEASLGNLAAADAGVLVDLLLSYRSVDAWAEMIALVRTLPPALAHRAMVQEQLAFALNREGRGADAEAVLDHVVAQHGPSSETYALLGRVYKDRWASAASRGEPGAAADALRVAIDYYVRGFEADCRDAYPGVNALTLMEVVEPADPRRDAMLPVVKYAVERRIASGEADYWDRATVLELAVLAGDRAAAEAAAPHVVDSMRETWEPASTARNLRLIRDARARRGDDHAWIDAIEQLLLHASG